ncbi:hypothetical protein EV659_10830 [Rhodothalassium salexigens DSM 2132]|uniref:Uncharacterized protein n=1 Tax=Rhodothalassium salexigens DSM 2132 TaxID=1188247 RepID=A0A4R2PFJ3_RHOSA|nr:hypothetical protein [Rhodothalassium salexigens]MBB4212055.1 hypothetical protein [Rhodothalassium salexigens DSM 2132]MBK1638091.1 hypothetical protein [Rhodothalassium salexigens DSM 2132]TCP32931.1 hypothetical protein EV659_10830 [Rhodothalassium salexigens DSM 2132]
MGDQSNVWQVPNGGTPLPTSPGFAADQGPFQSPAPSTVINDEHGNPLTFGPSGQLMTFEQARLGDIDTMFFSRNADCGNNDLVTCLPETNTLVSPLDRWVVTDPTPSQTTINGERYALALDAVRDPNTGDIVCRVNTLDDLDLPGDGSLCQPNVPTDIEECLPFNPFGISQNDQDVLNYLLQDQVQFSEITQQVAGANISGALFDLPAGAVSLVLGFVHREEGGAFNGGQGTNINPNQRVQNVGGSFNSDEFYGEVLIPVIANGTAFGADLPLIDFVEVNSAAPESRDTRHHRIPGLSPVQHHVPL